MKARGCRMWDEDDADAATASPKSSSGVVVRTHAHVHPRAHRDEAERYTCTSLNNASVVLSVIHVAIRVYVDVRRRAFALPR